MNSLRPLLKIMMPPLNLILNAMEIVQILYLAALMSSIDILMAALISITWKHGNEFPAFLNAT